MITKVRNYAGITGREINDVGDDLIARGYEYTGFDVVDLREYHIFSRGDEDLAVCVVDGKCLNVEIINN